MVNERCSKPKVPQPRKIAACRPTASPQDYSDYDRENKSLAIQGYKQTEADAEN